MSERHKDIIRKLRTEWPVGPGNRVVCATMTEAADVIEELREVIKKLLVPQDEPCYYDHHNYCQAHYLEPAEECCVRIAREIIGDKA